MPRVLAAFTGFWPTVQARLVRARKTDGLCGASGAPGSPGWAAWLRLPCFSADRVASQADGRCAHYQAGIKISGGVSRCPRGAACCEASSGPAWKQRKL